MSGVVDPFDVVRRQGPRPDAVTDDELARTRARFAELTGLDLGTGEPAPLVVPLEPHRTRRSPRRRLLPAVAVAAVAALVAFVVTVGSDDPPSDVATAPAPELLGDLADVAAARPDPPADWGQQYLRVNQQLRTANSVPGVSGIVPTTVEGIVERWMARDGTWVDDAGQLTVTTERPSPIDLSNGLDTFSTTSPPGTQEGQLDATALAALPTGTSELAAYLDEASADSDDPEFDAAYTLDALLEQPALPSAVRAGLMRVLADDPTVRQAEGTFAGRSSVVATVVFPDRQLVLTFDATTGALLRSQIVATAPIAAEADAQPGDLILERTIDQSGLVAELGDRP